MSVAAQHCWCLHARNSRKHNASDEYVAAIWLAVARKAYGQDVCRSYLVKHQQPRTWAWFGCFGETTLDDCVFCAKVLPSGNEAEVIQLAKAGKIRAGKGKIIHVGGLVFVGVGAYIFQVPRHLFQLARFFLHPQMRRACYLAAQEGVRNLKTILRFNRADLYLAFNKETDDAVVAQLQQALDAMRAQGEIEQYFNKYF